MWLMDSSDLLQFQLCFFVFCEIIKDAGYENMSKLLVEKYNELEFPDIKSN